VGDEEVVVVELGFGLGFTEVFGVALGVEVATIEGDGMTEGVGEGEELGVAVGLNMVLKYTTPIKAATITTIKKPIRAGIIGNFGFGGTYTGAGATGGSETGETG
jgi:hypothetical protein